MIRINNEIRTVHIHNVYLKHCFTEVLSKKFHHTLHIAYAATVVHA